MIEIPKKELLESLKMGYEEVRDCLANGNDEGDIGHVKGFCVTIEQILSVYGKVTKEEIIEIKKPILGNISLRRKDQQDNLNNGDLETPTVFRKKMDFK
jgi:hypothetical protein